MLSNRIRAGLASAALAIGVLASCTAGDDATAPAQAAPSQQQLLGVIPTSSLSLFACQTPSYGSVTRTIGPEGGTIEIGPHTFLVPAQALAKPVTITATAPQGSSVRVDFQPEGLTFAKPAALTLSYRHCAVPPLLPQVVYVGKSLRILEVVPSVFDAFGSSVTGRIEHFSGYAIAD